MTSTTNQDYYYLARSLAKKYKITILDLLLISAYALDEYTQSTEKKVNFSEIKKAIRDGAKLFHSQSDSISFKGAIHHCLLVKQHRRPRTLKEIGSITNRLLKIRGLGQKKIHLLTAKDWRLHIQTTFTTPRQQLKARTILHGIYAQGIKKGWCSQNPINHIDIPHIEEKRIPALTLNEVQRLMEKAASEEDGTCLAPIAIMLYAGVRPFEVQRIKWENINLAQNIITLFPKQAKTGGTRHITIEPILAKLLQDEFNRLSDHICNAKSDDQESSKNHISTLKICPKNWQKKWRNIREKAGWSHKSNHGQKWFQDCLRHTFASYHALYYKDMQRLQYEMGHRSIHLLKTRYINMQGITPDDAKQFWNNHH